MSSQERQKRSKKPIQVGDTSLGNALRDLRTNRFRKGQKWFAKVVHMNKDKIGDFERGARLPEIAELQTILDALRASKSERDRVFGLYSSIVPGRGGTNQSYGDYLDTLAHDSRQLESVAERVVGFTVEKFESFDNLVSATARSLQIRLRDLVSDLNVARADEKEKAARSARIATTADVIKQGLVSKALRRYYTPASLKEGNLVQYAINVDGTQINLAVATKPDWIERSVKLATNQERCRLVDASSPEVQIHVKSVARQLAFIEQAGTRIWNAWLYRLIDISLRANRLGASFSLDEFLRRHFTIGLLHDELVEAIIGTDLNMDKVISNSDRLLPLRQKLLPDGPSLANFANRICGGGPDVLLAIARPAPYNDFAIPVKRREMNVATAQGLLILVPQGCHQPMVDAEYEVNPSFTVYREIYEELFQGEEAERNVRRLKPDWFFEECEPVRWLRDQKDKRTFGLTGFGIDLVCGYYMPAILLAVHSEEFWRRYGGSIKTNLEVTSDVREPYVSSRNRQRLSTLIRDAEWNDESLFSFVEGLKRLKMLAPQRVDLPKIEQVAPKP